MFAKPHQATWMILAACRSGLAGPAELFSSPDHLQALGLHHNHGTSPAHENPPASLFPVIANLSGRAWPCYLASFLSGTGLASAFFAETKLHVPQKVKKKHSPIPNVSAFTIKLFRKVQHRWHWAQVNYAQRLLFVYWQSLVLPKNNNKEIQC